jgi:hypothetical protein
VNTPTIYTEIRRAEQLHLEVVHGCPLQAIPAKRHFSDYANNPGGAKAWGSKGTLRL